MEQRKRVLKLGLACVAALALSLGCEKKDEETAPGGGTDGSDELPSISLSGTYNSSCTAIPGMTLGGATHRKTQITFGSGGVADRYEYVTFYTANSSCTGNQYASLHRGTYAVGSATTTPANGYAITFTADLTQLLVYTSAAHTDLTSGCGSHSPYSAAPSIKTLSSTFNCMNIASFEPDPVTFHNILVKNSTSIEMPAPTTNNEGFASVGAVPTTMSMTLSQ